MFFSLLRAAALTVARNVQPHRNAQNVLGVAATAVARNVCGALHPQWLEMRREAAALAVARNVFGTRGILEMC